MATDTAFICLGGAGDCAEASAVLREWKRLNPERTMTWVIFEHNREIADMCPGADEVHPFHCPSGGVSRMRWKDIVRWCKPRFKWVISPQCHPQCAWETSGNVDLQTIMYGLIGLRVPERPALWLDPPFPSQEDMEPDEDGVTWPLLLLQTMCGTQHNPWTADQFNELIRRVNDQGVAVHLHDKTPFKRLLGLMKYRAFCHLGLDSGPSMLATACDVPQVCMMSSESYLPKWMGTVRDRGYKDKALIDDFTDPTVDHVYDAVMRRLEAYKRVNNGGTDNYHRAGAERVAVGG